MKAWLVAWLGLIAGFSIIAVALIPVSTPDLVGSHEDPDLPGDNPDSPDVEEHEHHIHVHHYHSNHRHYHDHDNDKEDDDD